MKVHQFTHELEYMCDYIPTLSSFPQSEQSSALAL